MCNVQRRDRSSRSPKEPMSNLSSSPCTGCRLWLASSSSHWYLHIEQPQAQYPPTSTHFYESTFPPEVWDPLVSDALWCYHREAQNHFPEYFRLPFLADGMIFQPLSGMLIPWQFSSDIWNLTSFVTIWLHLFVINNFYFLFFHTQHNRISKIKQNKTADTYSTSQGSIKREGEREGQQEHKSHSFK